MVVARKKDGDQPENIFAKSQYSRDFDSVIFKPRMVSDSNLIPGVDLLSQNIRLRRGKS